MRSQTGIGLEKTVGKINIVQYDRIDIDMDEFLVNAIPHREFSILAPDRAMKPLADLVALPQKICIFKQLESVHFFQFRYSGICIVVRYAA